MTSLEKTKVEVPIAWLKKLLELGKKADVKVYSNGIQNGWRKDSSRLEHLKGYIESAEQFLAPQSKESDDE